MRKLHFFALILSVLFISCSKDDEVKPSAALEGKYDLKSLYLKIVTNELLDNDISEETIKFTTGSITFGNDNKLETDLGFAGIDDDDLLRVVTPYNSEYSIKGNELTLQIKDFETGKLVPLVFDITKNENNELQLASNREKLLVTAKALDEIEGETSNQVLLSVYIKEINLNLNLTK